MSFMKEQPSIYLRPEIIELTPVLYIYSWSITHILLYSLCGFAHYLIHSLFGLDPGQLVFITKKGGLERKNCPKMILFKIWSICRSKLDEVSDLEGSYITLGGIASICFRFHFQQTLRIQIHRCQECLKTRNFVRNSKILIARSTIQPKLSKMKNNLPFFKEFWWII